MKEDEQREAEEGEKEEKQEGEDEASGDDEGRSKHEEEKHLLMRPVVGTMQLVKEGRRIAASCATATGGCTIPSNP